MANLLIWAGESTKEAFPRSVKYKLKEIMQFPQLEIRLKDVFRQFSVGKFYLGF
jgi:hypothetical protein